MKVASVETEFQGSARPQIGVWEQDQDSGTACPRAPSDQCWRIRTYANHRNPILCPSRWSEILRFRHITKNNTRLSHTVIFPRRYFRVFEGNREWERLFLHKYSVI